MDISILEDIGLSRAEIKVYIALLELGSARAGQIIEKSGLQSSVVHATLPKLVDKGLTAFVKEGKINRYSATNPKHIIEFIEDKKVRFQQLLPELLLKQQTSQHQSEVVIYRDIKGVRELLIELLHAGGNAHHTFGSAKESLMLGEAWWVNYHRKRMEKKIFAKLLFNESLRDWTTAQREKGDYQYGEARFTSTGFEPLTETIIRNHMVGIILWIPKPIGILIRQQLVANSYDQFFTLLWDSAK